MKKNLLFLILVCCFLQFCSKPETMVLFPEREAVNKQSKLFFDEVETGLPQLKNVSFFIKSKNYFSAYIKLGRIITQTQYFIDLFSYVEENHFMLIEKFAAVKQNLNLKNYNPIIEKTGFSEFEFYLLILHKLYNDYKGNKLSGNTAYIYWNIILDISNRSLTTENKWNTIAILNVSSNIFFFKNKEKYKKKIRQLEKININKKPDHVLLKYILKKSGE